MRRSQPLLHTHPQFIILDHPGSREFRVENWRLARDGSNKVFRFYGWSWLDAVVPVLLAALWPAAVVSPLRASTMVVAVVVYAYLRCTQLLWESVIAIPSLGVQLETHRGLPSMPLFVTRQFIPLAFLRDFVVNEGLRGWEVRYYLAAITLTQSGGTTLLIAYENILPYFPILLEVYHGVHEIMFDAHEGADAQSSFVKQ